MFVEHIKAHTPNDNVIEENHPTDYKERKREDEWQRHNQQPFEQKDIADRYAVQRALNPHDIARRKAEMKAER